MGGRGSSLRALLYSAISHDILLSLDYHNVHWVGKDGGCPDHKILIHGHRNALLPPIAQHELEDHAPKCPDATLYKDVQVSVWLAREQDEVIPVLGEEGLDGGDAKHVIAEDDADQEIPILDALHALVPIGAVVLPLLKLLEVGVDSGKVVRDLLRYTLGCHSLH